MLMPTFYTEADLPLATETVVVKVTLDEGRQVAAGHDPRPVVVERKIVEGTRVPAELVDAWREQTGGATSEGEDRAAKLVEEHARALKQIQEAEAAAGPGEVPESEKGDPAPARMVPTRAPADQLDGVQGAALPENAVESSESEGSSESDTPRRRRRTT
jgi:hypothetical protein